MQSKFVPINAEDFLNNLLNTEGGAKAILVKLEQINGLALKEILGKMDSIQIDTTLQAIKSQSHNPWLDQQIQSNLELVSTAMAEVPPEQDGIRFFPSPSSEMLKGIKAAIEQYKAWKEIDKEYSSILEEELKKRNTSCQPYSN